MTSSHGASAHLAALYCGNDSGTGYAEDKESDEIMKRCLEKNVFQNHYQYDELCINHCISYAPKTWWFTGNSLIADGARLLYV